MDTIRATVAGRGAVVCCLSGGRWGLGARGRRVGARTSTLSPALTAWVSRLAVEVPFDQIPAVVHAPEAVVTRETAYVTYHQTRMPYPTYHVRGLPVGSGRVEGPAKRWSKPD